MMLGATAVAQEAENPGETPVAKKLICKANFDAAAVALNQPHYLGVDTNGKLIMTNAIDDMSSWIISEPAEDGAVTVQNVELEDYLFVNESDGRYLTADAPAVYFIDSPVIDGAIGITTTKDATTGQQVFLNISGSGQAANIAIWSLDRGSSFFVMDYVEGDTDETVQERVQAKLARIEGLAKFEKYCDASSTGRINKEWFLPMLENAADEDFAGMLESLTDTVMSYFISDLEANATIKSQASGKYVTAPATTAEGITLSETFNLTAGLWQAVELNGIMGTSVTGATCRFKLQNVSSGLYIGKQTANSQQVPVTDKSEDAAIFRIVAGNNGLEIEITNAIAEGAENAVENNFLNADQTYNKLVVYQFENDNNAYWIAENLSALTFNEVGADFTGEFEGDESLKIYSSITGFSISVPRGATATGIGSIVFGKTGEGKEMTAIYEKTVAEALNGVTPTQGSKTISDWVEDGTVNEWGMPNWKEVQRTIEYDVYTIALAEAITEPGNYAVEVSANAFSVNVTEGETTTTKFTPEIRYAADIPSAKFVIAVAPEQGLVDAIVDITLTVGSEDADNNEDEGIAPLADAVPTFNINPAYNEGINVTLKREWSEPKFDQDGKPVMLPDDMGQEMEFKEETVLDINTAAMAEYFTYNDEDPTSPMFTIPANQSAVGEYRFIIPEGFFIDDNGAQNDAVFATWTIEVKDGIKTVTNLSVNGNTIFDLQGRKVAKASKGVFIINGKKVLVK